MGRLLSKTARHRYTPNVNSLWTSLVDTTRKASQKGALVSLPTTSEIIEDRGIPFVVHTTADQNQKAIATRVSPSDRPFNPFLPPDPDLLVGEISPQHLGVLNKFNVIRHHLLIVTRVFEAQEALLNLEDFSALLTAMNEVDGLGFYNGGTAAGASQAHKHLQLIPLPLGEGPQPTPIDSVIKSSATTGDPTRVPGFDFPHGLILLGGSRLDARDASEVHRLYRHACTAVGVHDETNAHNLLITRRWMLVVPRSREHWEKVSLNALAFAGSLLVRNPKELEELKTVGPLAVLKAVVEEDPP